MPLINQVGRRALSVRMLVAGMYLLLLIGAVSMAYPFLLMIAISTAGRGDFQEYHLVPRYWFSEEALFTKYLLDTQHTQPVIRTSGRPTDDVPVTTLASWFGIDRWFLPRDIRAEELRPVMDLPPARRRAMADDFRTFLARACPSEFRVPAALFDYDSVLSLQRDYQAWLQKKYGGLDNVNRMYIETAEKWEELGVVGENYNRAPGSSLRERDWREFVETRPPERAALFDADVIVYDYLRGRPIPASFDGPRDRQGKFMVTRITFEDLYGGKLGREIKNDFIRSRMPARFIKLDVSAAAAAWRAYLIEKGAPPETPLTQRIPDNGAVVGLWTQFLTKACPLEALQVLRPEDGWHTFLRQRYGTVAALNQAYGTSYANLDAARIPYAPFKYDCFLRERPGLRMKYLTHNMRTVIEFVALHGSALWVTVLYIILAVAGTLTVSPLAAYAMSRFRLKESHHILIFMLATMAFPGEVLMIPNFLMIKNFPWVQILAVLLCLLAFFLLVKRLARHMHMGLAATLGLLATIGMTGWVLPELAQRMHVSINVSLMNTFWALILPGLANGYGIFLLKGFFDSLPAELYEAGMIDGASELRMFWAITLPMCKPILAVMALGAFSGAYGAFMHAFLICQDPSMWTIMVFLYEFQQRHIVPMVMASLVLAAIPTLLVFVFCQNIILRGIVIPTFK